MTDTTIILTCAKLYETDPTPSTIPTVGCKVSQWEKAMRKIYTRLTVGELRKAMSDLPDDAPVLVDFHFDADTLGETTLDGTATWCMATNAKIPHLRIDATEEMRS